METAPREPPGRGVTIYDVAKVAGVSPSTVSRAFSRPGRVSARTAQHVRQIAADLGYRSEEIFPPPAPTRTQLIGMAVSDITNPFYFPIIRGGERAAAEAGFTLVLTDADECEQTERESLKRALPVVDGIVIASTRLSDTDLRSIGRNVPVVVLNRPVPGLNSVIPDTDRAVRRAVEHLASLGHRKVCYVAGPEASWVDGARWRALREASLELGLDLHDQRIGPVPPTVPGGGKAAISVIAKRATAVLCYNDMIAIGVIRGLRARGVAVPGQVSVIGFDNTVASSLVTPGLTTVASPLVSLGEAAMRNVIALGRGATPHGKGPTVIPCRLIVRESTGPPPP